MEEKVAGWTELLKTQYVQGGNDLSQYRRYTAEGKKELSSGSEAGSAELFTQYQDPDAPIPQNLQTDVPYINTQTVKFTFDRSPGANEFWELTLSAYPGEQVYPPEFEYSKSRLGFWEETGVADALDGLTQAYPTLAAFYQCFYGMNVVEFVTMFPGPYFDFYFERLEDAYINELANQA